MFSRKEKIILIKYFEVIALGRRWLTAMLVVLTAVDCEGYIHYLYANYNELAEHKDLGCFHSVVQRLAGREVIIVKS